MKKDQEIMAEDNFLKEKMWAEKWYSPWSFP